MSQTPDLLERLLDPVGRALTPEVAHRLVHLQADETIQHRIDYLADRNTEGLLSSEEKSEYESLVAAGGVISILQAKAHALLSGSSVA